MSQNPEQNRDIHEYWMRKALVLAEQAASENEVPVGAILVQDNEIIGTGFNQVIHTCDPTAHAEIVALRNAAQFRKNYRLPDTSLYVTIEPCTMCLGAMIHARVDYLVFGAREPRSGVVVSQASLLDTQQFNHKMDFAEGVLAQESSALLQKFFKERRAGK